MSKSDQSLDKQTRMSCFDSITTMKMIGVWFVTDLILTLMIAFFSLLFLEPFLLGMEILNFLSVDIVRVIFFIMFFKRDFNREYARKMAKVTLITAIIAAVIFVFGIAAFVIWGSIVTSKAEGERKENMVWFILTSIWVDIMLMLTFLLIDLWFVAVFKHYNQHGNVGDNGPIVEGQSQLAGGNPAAPTNNPPSDHQ